MQLNLHKKFFVVETMRKKIKKMKRKFLKLKERIAIIEGVRTPMGKAGGQLKHLGAVDLGVHVVKEILARSHVDPFKVDELIFGNVAQPADAANIARVIALKAGLSLKTPACTVHRNCASGMESITTCANKILAGHGEIFVAGGTESMSHIPLLYNEKMTNFFTRITNPKASVWNKLNTLFSFRLNFLNPIIGVMQGLTDPVCGLNMGQTAEVLAKEFAISREEQDAFALMSHQRASKAIANGIFKEEIHPIRSNSRYASVIEHDEGPRAKQTLEALAKLKPYFDRKNGTVTVGNACPITDGAAAVLLMTEKKAKQLKLTPLGYLKDYAYASLEPERMGLGPIYATDKLFKRRKMTLKDIQLIEINEAFAAQVIANERAFASDSFAQKHLDRPRALGKIDRSILNVNGGAVALGHPVGMTGTRIVIHLLKELRRRKKTRGLASLCVGGGQGAALLLETK